jgi:hypothetical protein
VREADRIRIRVPIGKEPHELFETRAVLRDRGRAWLVKKISIVSPPRRCSIELFATPTEDGGVLTHWEDPDA